MNSNTDHLGGALEAFILEHEYCGELDGGVEDARVWMTCSCGAVINRSTETRIMTDQGGLAPPYCA